MNEFIRDFSPAVEEELLGAKIAPNQEQGWMRCVRFQRMAVTLNSKKIRQFPAKPRLTVKMSTNDIGRVKYSMVSNKELVCICIISHKFIIRKLLIM